MKRIFNLFMKMTMCIFLLLTCSCKKKENNTSDVSQPEPLPSAETEDRVFEVTMLDVGQGLSILIQADGHYMLYDGGPREASSYVVSYLKEHGIEELDYMIASHYDGDHLNGLIGVLHTAEVNNLLAPDYEVDGYLYRSFMNAAEDQKLDIISPTSGEVFEMGNAVIRVLGPLDYTALNENNRSIVVKVEYDDFSVLLAGDAESYEEEQMLASGADLKADVLIVGHHGSATSSSQSFLETVQPSYVMISVGKDNDYKHPHTSAMKRLQKTKAMLYRTDLQSEVTLTLINGKLSADQYPTNDWTGGDDVSDRLSGMSDDTSSDTSAARDYVLNVHTKKFHYPDCSGAMSMKESNRQDIHTDRQSLLEQGFDPCGTCMP